MRRALAAVGVLALLAVPATADVTYPQAGYDAGRTGAVPFDLPRANDTAFELALPGTPTGTVAVDGSTAHVVTLDQGVGEDEELTSNALWTIDLDRAEVTKRFTIFDERPPDSTAFTDGEHVYTQVGRQVTAYGLDGEELWTWQAEPNLPGAETVTCGNDPAIDGERMFLACIEERPRPSDDQVPRTALQVAALDRSTGEADWVWLERLDRDPVQNGQTEEQAPSEERDIVTADVAASQDRVVVHGLAYERGGDRIGESLGPGAYQRFFELFGVDAADGELLWSRAGPIETRYWDGFGIGCPARDTMERSKPVATANRAFIRFGPHEPVASCSPTEPPDPPEEATHALEPTSGEDVWKPVGSTDAIDLHGSHGMAVREDVLLAASEQTLTRIDAARGSVDWRFSLEADDPLVYGEAPIVFDGERAVVATLRFDTRGAGIPPTTQRLGYGLQAVDVATGEPLWHHPLFADEGDPDRTYAQPGFGPGVIVAPQPDGCIQVLGTTAVSMGSPDVDEERFPGVGEDVTLDLSDTEPGAFGPATRYRVDWGDGTVNGWQASSTFTHAYEDPGNHTARLVAGNEANQTASTFVTMRVGQTEPNFVETAFQQENQDMTFGVLGVAIALGGGAVGLARRYRERSRLQEELDAIEELFEETKDRPAECEAQLTERKAHARGLLTDGYLTEEQLHVVENRIEELRGHLRVSMLDERFAFLPHGMVQTLERMLADGHINAWEHETFMQALDEQDELTEEQKGKVERLVGQWLDTDRGS